MDSNSINDLIIRLKKLIPLTDDQIGSILNEALTSKQTGTKALVYFVVRLFVFDDNFPIMTVVDFVPKISIFTEK